MSAADVPGGSILVVNDEEGIRAFLTDALGDAGHVVTAVGDGVAALAEIARKAFHVIVTDLQMPRMDRAALLAEVRRTHPDIEVIVLTGRGSIGSAVEAIKQRAFDYLEKPVESPSALRLAVGRALERHRLRAAQEVARVSLDLSFIDPSGVHEMDRDSGVNQFAIFFEVLHAALDGFGSSSTLRVGDTTWIGGLMMEM